MSALEQRLQVLINESQKARLDREAAATGRSVGAIVREAIDLRYSLDEPAKAVALQWIIEHGAKDHEEWADWQEIKAGILDDISARVPDA